MRRSGDCLPQSPQFQDGWLRHLRCYSAPRSCSKDSWGLPFKSNWRSQTHLLFWQGHDNLWREGEGGPSRKDYASQLRWHLHLEEADHWDLNCHRCRSYAWSGLSHIEQPGHRAAHRTPIVLESWVQTVTWTRWKVWRRLRQILPGQPHHGNRGRQNRVAPYRGKDHDRLISWETTTSHHVLLEKTLKGKPAALLCRTSNHLCIWCIHSNRLHHYPFLLTYKIKVSNSIFLGLSVGPV